ncbi:hypothetical protein CDAR_72181 [Caerostris darwini]|uniref:Uncharacterized protein n=1 Tax=Caerostris darwini TaxID=1538125 RepID=A0AAV4MLH0_9ARAC|nr:hypothetical protein CDAR_72181 [Caerostris darwini]
MFSGRSMLGRVRISYENEKRTDKTRLQRGRRSANDSYGYRSNRWLEVPERPNLESRKKRKKSVPTIKSVLKSPFQPSPPPTSQTQKQWILSDSLRVD